MARKFLSPLRLYSAASNPTGAAGDIMYNTSSGFVVHNGTSWIASLTNPMTTQGDIIYGGTSGAVTRLGVGTAGQALVVNSGATAPTWTTLTLENLPGAFVKKSVRCATTASITLSGTQTIDGIAVVVGDRVLVKDQSAPYFDNGIYVVSATAWSRAADANTADEIASALVAVDSGTANGGTLWDNDFKSTDTLGSVAMLWHKNIDSGSGITAGSTATNTFLNYAGTTATAGQLDGGLTTPSGTTRLNYGGYLYATRNYANLYNVISNTIGTSPAAGDIEFNSTNGHFYGTKNTTTKQGRIPAIHAYRRSTSGSTSASTGTVISLVGAGIPVESSTLYRFKMFIYWLWNSPGTTASACQLSFSNTGTSPAIRYFYQTHTTGGTGGITYSGYATVASATSVTESLNTAGSLRITNVEGFITTGTSAGTLTANYNSSAASGGAPIDAEAYTYWEIEKIGTSSTTNIAGAWV